jgi:hypothetical protein
LPRVGERPGLENWGCVCRGEGLLNFILEVSENGIEDSISGKDVIIFEVVVNCRLSKYVEALYCVKVEAPFFFFWKCNIRMTSCMLPRVYECSSRCSAYLEVCLWCMKERLCSLNLVLKSR